MALDPRAAMHAAIAVPGVPRDADGPVFREPWEAQAFAMALALHQKGLFTWKEWAAALADEIKRAQAAGDPDTGETYYRHWLATLENLVAAKERRDARNAAHAIATPGTTPPTAPRTARRSSSGRRISSRSVVRSRQRVTRQYAVEAHGNRCGVASDLKLAVRLAASPHASRGRRTGIA